MLGLPVAAYLTWEGRLIEGKGVSPSLAVGNETRASSGLPAGEDPQVQSALDSFRQM